MRISTPLYYQRGLNSLLSQQEIMTGFMDKLSTGRKYNTPKDDPIGTSKLFSLRQQENKIEVYDENSSIADFELSSSEEQLKYVTELITNAKETALAINKSTLSAADLSTLVTKMENVLSQLVDVANSNINGKYLFSGSKVSDKPIALNNAGKYTYRGDESVRKATIGPNAQVKTNDTGKDLFYGLETKDVTLSSSSGRVAYSANNPGLVNVGTLDTLDANELWLNNIAIPGSLSGVDTLSQAPDARASAISQAKSINNLTEFTGVIAEIESNVIDFTGLGPTVYADTTFTANELVINGVDLVGDTSVYLGTPLENLIEHINSFAIDGVVASDNAGELMLTSLDGRNINISSTGAVASGLDLGALVDIDGAGCDLVQRASVTLTDDKPFTVATNTFGATANDTGFVAGPKAVSPNAGTAVMSDAIMREAPDSNVPLNETYIVHFVTDTTYQIYKESDPTNPLTSIKTYAAGEDIGEARELTVFPADYVAGDLLVFDGIEISLSGAPLAGDKFTIDKVHDEKIDLFSSLQNVIKDSKAYQSEATRLSYHIGLALENLRSAEDNIISVRGDIGARLERIDVQGKINASIDLFAKAGISEITDLDYTSAITDYIQSQTTFQAAQSAIAQTSKLSLFNFL